MNFPEIKSAESQAQECQNKPIHWSDLTQIQERQFDPTNSTELIDVLTEMVVTAEGTSTEVVSSTPLCEAVDIGALERTLFETPKRTAPPPVSGVIAFRYRDYVVAVSSDGCLELYQPTDDTDQASR